MVIPVVCRAKFQLRDFLWSVVLQTGSLQLPILGGGVAAEGPFNPRLLLVTYKPLDEKIVCSRLGHTSGWGNHGSMDLSDRNAENRRQRSNRKYPTRTASDDSAVRRYDVDAAAAYGFTKPSTTKKSVLLRNIPR